MWPKTLFGIFGGGLLSISLILNLNYLLPVAIDQKLLIGLVVSFPIWAGAMTICFAANTAKSAMLKLGGPFCLSMILNIYFFIG